MIFFKKEKQLKYNIKLYYNILSKRERIELLKQIKPFLLDLGKDFPGLQSPPEMHYVYRMMELFDPTVKICKRIGIDNENVESMWGSFTDETTIGLNWHTHESPDDADKLSAVYMIENPDKCGTIFRINGEDYTFDMPTNSLVVFPSHYIHTSPETKSPRYSLAIDILSKPNLEHLER